MANEETQQQRTGRPKRRSDPDVHRRMVFLGNRLREARQRFDLSQEDLGNLMGTGIKTVSDYEIGRSLISPFSLLSVSRALGLPMEWFLNPDYQLQTPGPRPKGRAEWKVLYPDDPERGTLHYALDVYADGRMTVHRGHSFQP